MAQLINRLIACALILVLYTTSDGALDNLEFTLAIVGFLGALANCIFSFCASWYADRAAFIDFACQTTYRTPLLLIQGFSALYIACAMFLVVAFFLGLLFARLYARLKKGLVSVIDMQGYEAISGCVSSLLYFAEFLLMWVNFALIIWVRERAKSLFGPLYGDNAMGYGQIMASGFSLQTIVGLVAEGVSKFYPLLFGDDWVSPASGPPFLQQVELT